MSATAYLYPTETEHADTLSLASDKFQTSLGGFKTYFPAAVVTSDISPRPGQLWVYVRDRV